MANAHSQYFIIEANVLPEVFLKVAEAKHLLEVGDAKTVNDATRMVNMSRSAFYKYKDAIRPFNDMMNGRIINFQIFLKNEPGTLSRVLNRFASCGANILTINQTIPAGGVAAVAVGAETSQLQMPLEDMLAMINQEENVIRCEVQAG